MKIKIEEITIVDVLKFLWKAITFIWKMIEGIFVGTFELFTSAFNEATVFLSKRLIGFLCLYAAVLAMGLFARFSDEAELPYDLTYLQATAYLCIFFIMAGFFFVIFNIQENTERLVHLMHRPAPAVSPSAQKDWENHRSVTGYILIKEINSDLDITFTENGLEKELESKALIALSYTSSLAEYSGTGQEYVLDAGEIYDFVSFRLIWKENNKASVLGTYEADIPILDRYLHFKSGGIEIYCTTEMLKWTQDNLANRKAVCLKYHGEMRITDKHEDRIPTLRLDLKFDELSPSSEHSLQSYTQEIEERLVSLNDSPMRAGLDDIYPIELEIRHLNQVLLEAKEFENT